MQNYQYVVHYPTLTAGIFRLIVLFTIAFITQLLARFFSILNFESFVFIPDSFNFLTLFTHYFFYPISISGFFSFLFEMLILWGFGSELEQIWGTRNFYKYFFIGIYGGVLSIFLFHFFLKGLYAMSPTAGISSLLLAYALIFPNREVLFFFVLPLKMKWVALIMFIFLAIGSLNHLILNAGGAIFAGLYLYWLAKKGSIKAEYNKYSMRSSSQHHRIYENESTEKVSLKQILKTKWQELLKKRRLEKKKKEILRRIEMKEELDRILDKISKQGMNSLTKEERKFLDKASKEL